MKKLVVIITIMIYSSSLIAQVAIGKTTVDGDGILDFGSTDNTIVMSPVEDVTSMTATAGTIAFDSATGSFRYYNGTWSSVVPGGKTGNFINVTDNGTQGVIIGADSSLANGALILESTDKALILPKIADGEFNIKSPRTGMIYYDTVTKAVMIFNGVAWTRF